ncbi:MAG: hypothetical protein RIQ34_1591 [Bacteroidota bacterium]
MSIASGKPRYMNHFARVRELGKSRYALWLLVLRIGLGLALFFKGIQFMRNDALLSEVISVSQGIQKYAWLQVFIPWVHLFGGLMILIGLFTRWVALVQIPIVVGAIFFVKQDSRAYFGNLELPLAILVFLLLLVFVVLGDGMLSWKRLIQSERSIT